MGNVNFRVGDMDELNKQLRILLDATEAIERKMSEYKASTAELEGLGKALAKVREQVNSICDEIAEMQGTTRDIIVTITKYAREMKDAAESPSCNLDVD